MQPNSCIKKKRQSFSRQIRKGKIQKMQKHKRQKQMRIHNPLWYIPKLKHQILNQNYTLNDINQDILFLEANIKSEQFASFVEQDKIIEIILTMIIENLDPWKERQQKLGQGTNPNQLPVSIYCPHDPPKCPNCKFTCECMDLSDSPTDAGQSINNLTQDVEIDGLCLNNLQQLTEALKSSSLNETQKQWMVVFYNIINLLEVTLQHYLSQNKHFPIKPFSNQASKLTKFSLMFINTTEIIQGLILDLINYGHDSQPEENMSQTLKVMFQQPERMYLIVKIVSFLSKIGKVSYLTALHWPILLKLYCQFMSSQRSEVKNGCNKVKEIKEMFVVMGKSFQKETILSDSHLADKISQLVTLWVVSINQNLRTQSSCDNLNKTFLRQMLETDFYLLLSILTDVEYLEKQLNNELKQMLGELLQICQLLEEEEFGFDGQLKYMFLSPRIVCSEESQMLKRCKEYCEKIVKVLYEQMDLGEEELHRISEAQPSLKPVIERMIDADSY